MKEALVGGDTTFCSLLVFLIAISHLDTKATKDEVTNTLLTP